MKMKGCRHANLFQKKLYFYQTTIIYNYEKRLAIFTPGATPTKFSHTSDLFLLLHRSATHSKTKALY